MTKKDLQWEVCNKIAEPVSKKHILSDILNYAAVAVGIPEKSVAERIECFFISREFLAWLNKTVYSVNFKINGIWNEGYYNVSEMRRGATPNLSTNY